MRRRLMLLPVAAALLAACGGTLAAKQVRLKDGRTVQCVVAEKGSSKEPVGVTCDWGPR